MNNVKAALRVVLYANTVEVAESEDAQLWQRVLAAIQGEGSALPKAPLLKGEEEVASSTGNGIEGDSGQSSAGPIGKFASDISVSAVEVEAACAPSTSEPYLILDHDAWAAFKTQLGDRGPYAVSPAVAAATLLALWSKNSTGQPSTTQVQAQAVLKGINVRDSNPSRGIKRAEWLQPRQGGVVIINPAKMAKAKMFARCFCKQDWSEWKA